MMKFKIAALPADKVKRELREAVRENSAKCETCYNFFVRSKLKGDNITADTHMRGATKYQRRVDNARAILQALPNWN